MGVSYTAVLYWGVPEPTEWQRTRRGGPSWRCSNNHIGPTSQKYCPACGQPFTKVRDPNAYPFDIYGGHEFVHSPDYDGGPWIFGVECARAYEGDRKMVFSMGAQTELEAFLKELGYEGPTPTYILALRVS